MLLSATLLLTAHLSASMDAALMKKSPQLARSKNTTMGTHVPDPGKAGKKKVQKKNWTLAQTGGCGS